MRRAVTVFAQIYIGLSILMIGFFLMAPPSILIQYIHPYINRDWVPGIYLIWVVLYVFLLPCTSDDDHPFTKMAEVDEENRKQNIGPIER